MSACRLHELSHMFVISNNTWHERGILGKKGERRGPYILGREGKGKRIEKTKQIPSLLAGLGLQAYVSFLDSGQSLLKKCIFLIPRFHFATFSTPTVSRGGENIKIPERDQR